MTAMVGASREWYGHLSGLLTDTGRTWWGMLPTLILVQVVTWSGSQLLRFAAAWLSPTSQWLALALIALSFVVLLSGVVIMLRLVGDHVGTPAALAGTPSEGTGTGITHTLAVTLLPFLGIYASFGKVQDAAQQVVLQGFVISGNVYGDSLEKLNPTTPRDYLVVSGIVVGAYVLRRVLDSLRERTGHRAYGAVAATVEAFFMLTLLMAGQRVLVTLWRWFTGRQYQVWIDDASASLARTAGLLRIDLPTVLTTSWHWLADTAWPALTATFAEPVLWLAMTALACGSQVRSLAELWQTDPGRRRTSGRRATRVLAHRAARASRTRRAWLEFQEAFLGDVDDKYLPTWHSLRLILQVGIPFLAAFALLHALVRVADSALRFTVASVIGGHDLPLWASIDPVISLVMTTLVEPFRLALLAVAFHRAITWRPARTISPTPVAVPA